MDFGGARVAPGGLTAFWILRCTGAVSRFRRHAYYQKENPAHKGRDFLFGGESERRREALYKEELHLRLRHLKAHRRTLGGVLHTKTL